MIQKRRSCARDQAESYALVEITLSITQAFYFQSGSREPRQNRAFQIAHIFQFQYIYFQTSIVSLNLLVLSLISLVLLRNHANTVTMAFLQEFLRLRVQRICREQRARLNLGEKVYWVTDGEGVQQQMVLLKSNGTLFKLNITLGNWFTLDKTTLTEIQTSPMWPYTAGSRPLTDEQVALPWFVRDMPGDYMHPRYGFTNQWLKFVLDRPVQLKPLQVQAAKARTLEDQTWRCLRPQSYLKVVPTAGSTWTPAPRAVTNAPVPAVENLTAAPIQPVAAQTLGPVQSSLITIPVSGQQQSQSLLIQPVTTLSESHSAVPSTVGSASFIAISTFSVTLKLNLNLNNLRFNSVQTNLCVDRTIQFGNKLNFSNVSINWIGSLVTM